MQLSVTGPRHIRIAQTKALRSHLDHLNTSAVPRPPHVPVSSTNRSYVANHRNLPQLATSRKRWQETAFRNEDQRARHDLVRQRQLLARVPSSQANLLIGDPQRDQPRMPIRPAQSTAAYLLREANLPAVNHLNKPAHTVPTNGAPQGPRPYYRYHPRYRPVNRKVKPKECHLPNPMGLVPRRNALPEQPQGMEHVGVHAAILTKQRETPLESISGVGAGRTPSRFHSSTSEVRLQSSPPSMQRLWQHSHINCPPSKDKRKQPVGPRSRAVGETDGLRPRGTWKIPQSNAARLSEQCPKELQKYAGFQAALPRGGVPKRPLPLATAKPSIDDRQVAPRRPGHIAPTSNSVATPNTQPRWTPPSAETSSIPQPEPSRESGSYLKPKTPSSRSAGLHRSASVHKRPTLPMRLRPLTRAQPKSSHSLRTRHALVRRDPKIDPTFTSPADPLERPVRPLATAEHAAHRGSETAPSTLALSKFVESHGGPPGPTPTPPAVPSRRRSQHSTKRRTRIPPKRHGSKNAHRVRSHNRSNPLEAVNAPARHERTSISTAASSTPPATPEDSRAELPTIVDGSNAEDRRDSNRVVLDPEWHFGFSPVMHSRKQEKANTEEAPMQEIIPPAIEDKAQMTWNRLAALGLRLSPSPDSDSRRSTLELETPQSSDSGLSCPTFIPEPVAANAPIQTRSLEDDQFGLRKQLLARLADQKKIKAAWVVAREGNFEEQADGMNRLHPDVRYALTVLRSPV